MGFVPPFVTVAVIVILFPEQTVSADEEIDIFGVTRLQNVNPAKLSLPTALVTFTFPLEPLLTIAFIVESFKIVNDFEASVFLHFPKIAQIKEKLRDFGAIYAAMSGSGSSILGLFKGEPKFESNDFPAESFIWKEWISV